MDKEIESIKKYLPSYIYDTLRLYNPVNEIRLHKNKNVVIVSDNRNIITDTLCPPSDFNDIIDKLCNHSLHSYADTIRDGYISAGIYRVGVCGKFTGDNVSEINSINFRIPHVIVNVSGYVADILKQDNYRASVLIYSPPSGGKTTMLRDLIAKLSIDKRIAVIDTRNELYDSKIMPSPLIDVFSGYPKATAIEIATRTMSPEYIICDEIGSYNECATILSVQNTGVPFIASAHASDINELIRRKNIKLLHEDIIFDYYIGIKRRGNMFDFNVTRWEDVTNV